MKLTDIFEQQVDLNLFVTDSIPLYRGSSNQISSPTALQTRPRKGSLTDNIKMASSVWIKSQIPELSKMPDRTKSIFCTTKRSIAAGYGHVNIVAPSKSITAFGWAKDDFIMEVDPRSTFSKIVKQLANYTDIMPEQLVADTTGKIFSDWMAEVDVQGQRDAGFVQTNKRIVKQFSGRELLFKEYVIESYNQTIKTGGIGVVSSLNDLPINQTLEVWFEGEYAMIPESMQSATPYIGAQVSVIGGDFKGFDGTVLNVSNGVATVNISIFGRDTPIPINTENLKIHE